MYQETIPINGWFFVNWSPLSKDSRALRSIAPGIFSSNHSFLSSVLHHRLRRVPISPNKPQIYRCQIPPHVCCKRSSIVSHSYALKERPYGKAFAYRKMETPWNSEISVSHVVGAGSWSSRNNVVEKYLDMLRGRYLFCASIYSTTSFAFSHLRKT